MKTFKWTVPEPRPSAVEERNWRMAIGIDPFKPTKKELAEYYSWEKARSGKYKTINRIYLISGVLLFLVSFLLDRSGVIDIATGVFYGFSATFIAYQIESRLSWNRYEEKRHKIQDFLSKKSDSGSHESSS